MSKVEKIDGITYEYDSEGTGFITDGVEVDPHKGFNNGMDLDAWNKAAMASALLENYSDPHVRKPQQLKLSTKAKVATRNKMRTARLKVRTSFVRAMGRSERAA